MCACGCVFVQVQNQKLEQVWQHRGHWYKLVAVVGAKYFSIYDGCTEYVIGKRMQQKARAQHKAHYEVQHVLTAMHATLHCLAAGHNLCAPCIHIPSPAARFTRLVAAKATIMVP